MALPARTPVGGTVDTSLVIGCLHHGVNHIGIHRTHIDADAANIATGQAAFELVPGGSSIDRFIERRLRATADVGEYLAHALMKSRIEHIGIQRIHYEVIAPGIGADLFYAGPGVAAVGGFIHAPVSAFAPYRSVGRHVDDI